ncbi:hypothetical protein [Fodinibius sp. AD559]|uniref:hypothetical protein n=1 Tax=Fodinibius sp. AD559 TaxID=3424179 RepID=UPI004046D51D
MSNQIILFGAGASYGSDNSNVPPLGADLFKELRNFNPPGWGQLPKNLADIFEEDFEKGMNRVADNYSHHMPILQRAMAAYFFNFIPSESNLYRKLGQRILNKNWDGTLTTLNYERLLEISLLQTGLSPVVQQPAQNSKQVEVCLPHGCCHLFSEGVRGDASAISFSGVNVTTDGTVKAISDPNEFQQRINNDAFPPVMSYFEPEKRTTSGASFIKNQRKRWEDLAKNAKKLAIIGVAVRPRDKHIWDPLAKCSGKIIYCSGQTGGENFKKWTEKNRPDSSDIIYYEFFDSAFDKICNHLGL